MLCVFSVDVVYCSLFARRYLEIRFELETFLGLTHLRCYNHISFCSVHLSVHQSFRPAAELLLVCMAGIFLLVSNLTRWSHSRDVNCLGSWSHFRCKLRHSYIAGMHFTTSVHETSAPMGSASPAAGSRIIDMRSDTVLILPFVRVRCFACCSKSRCWQ